MATRTKKDTSKAAKSDAPADTVSPTSAPGIDTAAAPDTAAPEKPAAVKAAPEKPAAVKAAPEKPAAVKAAPGKERRNYEVLGGPIALGRVNGELIQRCAGDTIYEGELEPELLQHLLAKREIADPNAPIPPSQADAVVAFQHLVDVAREVGAIKVSSGNYTLAGDQTQHKGMVALRSAVSIDQLKAAIVAKFND
jgi:hypothetical protein